ncbi:hypothetical protein INS49_014332 [Diaporthe citri]|uniref:uncharacterized protein n=1 Tax=Diaporthe citri TaxID=83186 RepID=UPI001C80138E|nr:uncharacterized protein INS49_014332 [Diaporthe citri]KAG6358448.1 hypothetical protein INS49_014332 [Diaporthe citri]
MSIPATKDVVFDVVGTLVAHDRLWEAMEERLGDKLKAAGIKPELLGACWIEAAEREYTYLSLSGRYRPFFEVFAALFYRMLFFAGVKNPRGFCAEEDVKWLVGEWQKLHLREGAKECVRKLRDAGFTVWCFTAGDIARVGGYFREAGVDMPAENLLSCDTVGVAKPVPEAYRPLLERLSRDGKQPWFAAAHMWDVSTARTVGFHGAYCTVLEAEPLYDVFGQLDVVGSTLPEMADKIIAATQ